jgi:hypothetical protein
MFACLAEEVYSSLPHTPAQVARFERALQESGSYEYEDFSAIYEEAAVRVKTLSGNSYLCFPNQCTCPDWSERGPIIGDGSIECCKHIIACHIEAQFVEPLEQPAPEPYWPEELTGENTAHEMPVPPILDADVPDPPAEEEEPEDAHPDCRAEVPEDCRMFISGQGFPPYSEEDEDDLRISVLTPSAA